jgi:hypothetical protein
VSTQNRKVYGFEVEGLGNAALHLGGYQFRVATDGAVFDGTKAYSRSLAEFPKKISTTCEPLQGHTRISTMEMRVDRLDLGDINPATRHGHMLLEYFWRARVQPIGYIGSTIAVGDTSFVVKMSVGEPLPVVGDLLYIGREVMYVSAVGGTADLATVTVTRGILATDAQVHETDDGEVFLQNPLRIDRRVTLYEYDTHAGTETVRWRGVVEAVELDDMTSVLTIKCIDILGWLAKRKCGRDRFEGTARVRRSIFSGIPEPILWGEVIENGPRLYDYRPQYCAVDDGYLPGSARNGDLGVSNLAYAVEIDGVAVGVPANPATQDPNFSFLWRWGVRGGGMLEVSGARVDADPGTKDVKAVEVIPLDADSPLAWCRDSNEALTDHPALVALNVLVSTGTTLRDGDHTAGDNGLYDWLPGRWGAGIPAAWVDMAAFEDLAQGYPTQGARGRAGYLGGGELKSYTDVIADLLQAIGAYFYLTTDGKISARLLADPGPGSTDATLDASALSGAANEGDAQGVENVTPVVEIEIETAQRGPGGKAAYVVSGQVMGQRNLTRYKYRAKTDKIESAKIYGDPVTHSLTLDEQEVVASLFRQRYRYTQDVLPRYRVTTAVGTPQIAAGQWVTLSHPYLYDGRTMRRGIEGARCLVLEAGWSPETDQTELVVVDWSPASRATTTLAPAWRVGTVTSGVVFELEADYFSPNDLAYMLLGSSAKLMLWTRDGQLRSTHGGAWAYSLVGTTLYLDDYFQDDKGDTDPQEGDIIRLAPYDDAVDDWKDVPYTWLADSAGKLGAADDDGSRWDV